MTETADQPLAEVKYWKALNQAITEEMERDERVVVVGEDVAAAGGPYGVTRGLLERFGDLRVRDAPISESLIAGLGVGMAATGLRPVVEIMYLDFTLLAMDQIINQAAKFSYFTGGRPLPLVVRTLSGVGGEHGAQHSQSIESLFCSIPGLTVVMPSSPSDAKGLLKASIRCDHPVIFIESLGLLRDREEVGGEPLALGVAAVRRTGDDITVVATGRMVNRSLEAAAEAAGRGISVEVIDPRTLQPLDEATISKSVRRTSRALVVTEEVQGRGVGAVIAAGIGERDFDYLDAPVTLVNSTFSNVPASRHLAEERVPSVAAILAAITAAV